MSMKSNTMAFSVLLVMVLPILAQPSLTLSTASVVYPGATLNVTASLTGSGGQNISGIGLTLPPGATAPVPGAASTAAAKTIWSSAANLLLIGFTNATPPVASNQAYADGAVMSFSYTVPPGAALGSPLSLALTGVLAASKTGTTVALTSAPLALTVGTNPTCFSSISANVAAYLAAPSIALMGQIVTELAAANGTGNCN